MFHRVCQRYDSLPFQLELLWPMFAGKHRNARLWTSWFLLDASRPVKLWQQERNSEFQSQQSPPNEKKGCLRKAGRFWFTDFGGCSLRDSGHIFWNHGRRRIFFFPVQSFSPLSVLSETALWSLHIITESKLQQKLKSSPFPAEAVNWKKRSFSTD